MPTGQASLPGKARSRRFKEHLYQQLLHFTQSETECQKTKGTSFVRGEYFFLDIL